MKLDFFVYENVSATTLFNIIRYRIVIDGRMAKRNLCRSFATITIFLLVLSPLIVIIKVQNLGALALTSYSDRNFGGSGLDDGKAVVQTADGG